MSLLVERAPRTARRVAAGVVTRLAVNEVAIVTKFWSEPAKSSRADVRTATRLRIEHDAVLPLIEQIRSTADRLESSSKADVAPVRSLLDRLKAELVPHERAEEELLLPLVARALGGSDSTAGLSRTHAELEHQVGRLDRLLCGLEAEAIKPEDIVELRGILYGLYAVARLHNAQEEETAFNLVPSGHQQ